MTVVTVNTYTHSVAYVADNVLKSLKEIIRLAGLDPSQFVDDWALNQRGVRTWLESEHLEQVILEIFDPKTDQLITRWDIDINYGYTGDGGFYTDTDQLRYAILKAGVVPSAAKYRLLVQNSAGRPDVEGWSSTSARSTSGMVRQGLGSTVQHNGLGGSSAYWRNK